MQTDRSEKWFYGSFRKKHPIGPMVSNTDCTKVFQMEIAWSAMTTKRERAITVTFVGRKFPIAVKTWIL